MTYGYYYNLNNVGLRQNMHPMFRSDVMSGIPKPIETVSNTIESGVDTFVKSVGGDDTKKKKNRKRAILAGSSVLVLGGITMLLNPRNSSKILSNMKKWQNKFDIKIKNSKNDFLKSNFYKFAKKSASFGEKLGNIVFNMNSGKDIIFKSMCTNSNKQYPKFLQERPVLKEFVKFFDDIFVRIFKKPHIWFTEKFDNISKWTVKGNYKVASKNLDALETSLKSMKDKLPADKKTIVEQKLAEIAKAREAFSETNLTKRFENQEKLMSNLENDLWKQIFHKREGYIKNSTSFWVQDALVTQKAQVEKEGQQLVGKLFGDKYSKGLYDDIFDIYKDHLTKDDLKNLDDSISLASKKLRKANKSECVEYFDKKRDLIVGGAPTDIVTAAVGLGACGIAVAKADKQDRASRAFTTGVPAVVGLGTSLACTAMLFSGGVGLLIGGVVGGITGVLCSIINKHVFGNDKEEELTTKEQKKETQNA